MIAPQDAAIASRDHGLPGLATVLDPEALAARLPSSMRRLGAAHIGYVRYKPGRSCVVGYCAQVDGVVEAYAKAHKAGAPASAAIHSDERDRQRFVVDEGAVSVKVFPTDSKLKALRRLATRRRFADLLEELIPDRAELLGAMPRALRYMPERRYVAQLVANGRPRAVLKAYSAPDFPRAAANADAFRSHGPLHLAPLLARSDDDRTLVFEWIPGRVLSDAVADPEFDGRELGIAGAALAEFHRVGSDRLAQATRLDEAATLRSAGRNLRILCPDLAPRLDALVRRLAGYLEQSIPKDLPIHGDFSPKQVVLTNGAVTLIDLDRAVRSDPALDLGLFLAHLEHDALIGRLPAGRLGAFRETLLAGYRDERGSVPVGLEPYVAIGLLRLAPHPFRFRYRDPGWPECIEAILGRAEEIAGEAGLR